MIYPDKFRALVLMGGMVMLLSSNLSAVVAKPGVQSVMQPDGSRVNVIRTGNAFCNRVYTTDGYLLTTDGEGFYVFADCGEDGMPAATAIRSVNRECRTAVDVEHIRRINVEAVENAFTLRQEMINATRDAKADARMKLRQKAGKELFTTHFPATGEQPAIAILVEFADKGFTIADPKQHYERMLNEEGYSEDGATGSARDFFVYNSGGMFTPQFDVYGPVTLAHSMKYYGEPSRDNVDIRPEEMIIEGCTLLNDEIDFTHYDRNEDGVIDNVFVFYPGYGQNDGGGEDAIWPHSNDMTKTLDREYYFDGMMLDHYACTNELKNSDRPDGIGTFCHEFSHVMGLPDLYPTIYTPAFTPGAFDIMDAGSYNNESRTPPCYSSFERFALGYIEPERLDATGDYTLNPLTRENHAFIMTTEREDEYFLFENRQQEGCDLYIPGHGMLVWHIDFNQKLWDSNSVNNFGNHQYVDLVEADNKKTKGSRDGDTFPGSKGVTSFNNMKKPYLRSWDGTSLPFELSNIAEDENGVVTFRLANSGSGVKSVVEGGVDVITVDGCCVSVAEGVGMAYDLSGRKVSVIGTTPVTLAPGLYILKHGFESHMIILK